MSDNNNFTIQPHPATTNDPSDLLPREGGGLKGQQAFDAFKAAGPYIPDKSVLHNLGQPLSEEELKKRSEELNRE